MAWKVGEQGKKGNSRGGKEVRRENPLERIRGEKEKG